MPTSKMLLIELEEIIDKHHSAKLIQENNSNLAKWQMLTAAEDLLLNIYAKDKDLHYTTVTADKLKYSMRQVLSRIDLETHNKNPIDIPSYFGEQPYKNCGEHLLGGEKYTAAVKLCTTIHEGLVNLRKEESTYFASHDDLWKNPGYSALELIDSEANDQLNIIAMSFEILTTPKKNRLNKEFIDRCKINKYEIKYEFDPILCEKFSKIIPQYECLYSENWEFPWCTGRNAKKLSWALLVRALYHMCSIRGAANHFEISGGGLENLCIVTNLSKLAAELNLICQVELQDCKNFIKALTFGDHTKRPDPALQPLIPINEDLLLLGCLNIITSRQDRNLLALHARILSDSFNRQSSEFEVVMTKKLEDIAKQRKLLYRCNIKIPGKKDAGDLDFVIFDERSKTILICELRWLLKPGDPREIVNKAKACIEKISKIKRKTEAATIKAENLIKINLEKNVDASEWSILGIIVVDGYSGVESSNSNFPIIPRQIFSTALRSFTRMDRLHAWAKSLSWLPTEGTHFAVTPLTMKFDSTTVEQKGFHILDGIYNYQKHIKKTISLFR